MIVVKLDNNVMIVVVCFIYVGLLCKGVWVFEY